MKILMIPGIEDFGGDGESGVRRVVEAYYKYLPKFDIELVNKDSGSYDLIASHAGCTGKKSDVAHLHGMYFTGDYEGSGWEHKANAKIVENVRYAKAITVPSNWVAEIFQRDMRIRPFVVPHGIECSEWHNNEPNMKFVLWNKNRNQDVCNPYPVGELAKRFRDVKFVSTYAPSSMGENVEVIGTKPHIIMRKYIQSCGVYLSTTKETFGIGVLEALASGKPVLGFRNGGNCDIVKHKENGYLATPGDYDDLAEGLSYCISNYTKLGINALWHIKSFTWEKAIEKLADVYRYAYSIDREVDDSVSVIIPTYNYEEVLPRAIKSVLSQTKKPKEIIIIDDGSEKNQESVLSEFSNEKDVNIIFKRQVNAGVANARNLGISLATSKYICCLDADDQITPDFLKICVAGLQKDKGLGITYTGLTGFNRDGSKFLSDWPLDFNYNNQIQGKNQIPTCCVFRKSIWTRTGGFHQRYAPGGAGSEDANFWTRAGAIGFDAQKVTNEGMFIYSLGTGFVSGNKNYKEVNWRSWLPWTKDGVHPFASISTPANSIAHKVYQYDEPIISVIIPVGNGHEKDFTNALDSLEAQNFRKWEAIVVWDSEQSYSERDYNAYPYVRLISTKNPRKCGPGNARNIGASVARGKYLVFLDADDWLYPEALQVMLDTEAMNPGTVVYSDYVGKSIVEEKDLSSISMPLLNYNPKTKEAVYQHKASQYNCSRAQSQPNSKDLYHWCLVTCLIPKDVHDKVLGFDENLKTWEDVDYHWRVAKLGTCYTYVPQSLIVYRFYTGTRRESAIADNDLAKSVFKELVRKHEDIEIMACKSCSQPSGMFSERLVINQNPIGTVSKVQGVSKMSDTDFVLAKYLSTNVGDHRVVGNASKIDYGYRCGGQEFLVHKLDIQSMSNLFVASYVPVEQKQVAVKQVVVKEEKSPVREYVQPEKPKPTISSFIETTDEMPKKIIRNIAPIVPDRIMKKPKKEQSEIFFMDITKTIAKQLQATGYSTADDIVVGGLEKLLSVKGIGKLKAEKIYNDARDIVIDRGKHSG